MKQLFGASWRTTLTGYLAGLPTIILDLLSAYQAGKFDGQHGLTLLLGIAFIVSGHLQKDAVVTHSTPQGPTVDKFSQN